MGIHNIGELEVHTCGSCLRLVSWRPVLRDKVGLVTADTGFPPRQNAVKLGSGERWAQQASSFKNFFLSLFKLRDRKTPYPLLTSQEIWLVSAENRGSEEMSSA